MPLPMILFPFSSYSLFFIDYLYSFPPFFQIIQISVFLYTYSFQVLKGRENQCLDTGRYCIKVGIGFSPLAFGQEPLPLGGVSGAR